jgi:TatD DNase family protein
MFTDTHCHPFDLVNHFPQFEKERRNLGVLTVTSACDLEEFSYNEKLAYKAAIKGAAPVFPCFAIHPQMTAEMRDQRLENKEQLEIIEKLAFEGRLAGIGECGYDLFNAAFKETEVVQDKLFSAHLEIALHYDLPVIIHVRRAMHKIFAAIKTLARCKAVIFHSWSGTFEEGNTLLRRGVNAYFSFGNTILNGHKKAKYCCSLFPAQRLLTETDAPFQPRRGQVFSQCADLPLIIEEAASLRREAASPINDAKELEAQIETNFKNIFTFKTKYLNQD